MSEFRILRPFLGAVILLFASCADHQSHQPVVPGPSLEERLARDQQDKISRELPAYKAAALKCEAAIGRNPLPIEENPEAAAKYLFPVPTCDDFISKASQLRRDEQEDERLESAAEREEQRRLEDLRQQKLRETIIRSTW